MLAALPAIAAAGELAVPIGLSAAGSAFGGAAATAAPVAATIGSAIGAAAAYKGAEKLGKVSYNKVHHLFGGHEKTASGHLGHHSAPMKADAERHKAPGMRMSHGRQF